MWESEIHSGTWATMSGEKERWCTSCTPNSCSDSTKILLCQHHVSEKGLLENRTDRCRNGPEVVETSDAEAPQALAAESSSLHTVSFGVPVCCLKEHLRSSVCEQPSCKLWHSWASCQACDTSCGQLPRLSPDKRGFAASGVCPDHFSEACEIPRLPAKCRSPRYACVNRTADKIYLCWPAWSKDER